VGQCEILSFTAKRFLFSPCFFVVVRHVCFVIGSPEAVLKALGERFDASGSPNQLTLLFGGGPGDWETKGIGHLARTSPEGSDKPSMLRRTIGGHYGQAPKVAELAVKNQVEAWTLPLG
jgi:propionate CoA-transferase